MNYCHEICELLEIRGLQNPQDPPSYGPGIQQYFYVQCVQKKIMRYNAAAPWLLFSVVICLSLFCCSTF